MPPTRFAGLPRYCAIAILVGMALAIFVLALVAMAQPDPTPSSDGSDIDMYAGVVEHMRHGEDFYGALRAGLSAGHYGMKSVFNWRTPFFMSLVALFPTLLGMQLVVIMAAIAGTFLACWLAWREAGRAAAGTMLLLQLISLVACLVPRGYLFSEMPAGMVILVSASAYGLGWRRIGLANGLLALFIRELAAPYVLVCAFLAWRDRRYRELALWAVGLLAYGAYFLWHIHMVGLHQSPADHGDPTGWMDFGGAVFVLNAAAFNGLMLAAPLWGTAILLPIAFIGLMAWPGPAGERVALTVFFYLALFAVAGKTYNSYWGALFTPIMMTGLIWFPAGVRDLWQMARSSRPRTVPV